MRTPGGEAAAEREFQTARVMQALHVDYDKAQSMVKEMQQYDMDQAESDPFAPAQRCAAARCLVPKSVQRSKGSICCLSTTSEAGRVTR